MRYLLDTNILLWWLEDDKKLKSQSRELIQDKANQILISIVSGIEIILKHKAGKLPLKTTLKAIFEADGFTVLNLNLNHLFEMDKLPSHPSHKDPFDRLLIAQAKAEKLTLITSDAKIWRYNIPLLRC